MQIFIIIAGDSAPWNLGLEDFRQKLAEYRPDARSSVTEQRDLRTREIKEHLGFDLEFPEGRRDGVYFPDLPYQELVVEDGPASDWAPILAWFLDLLPAGARAECFIEANPDPRPIPENATPEQILQIIEDLDAE